MRCAYRVHPTGVLILGRAPTGREYVLVSLRLFVAPSADVGSQHVAEPEWLRYRSMGQTTTEF